MALARSFTKKIKRGLAIRSSSVSEKEKAIQKAKFRPTISLPLELSNFLEETTQAFAIQAQDFPATGWKPVHSMPSSPTPSSSSSYSSSNKSYMSTPDSSHASSSPRTSYESRDEYFAPPSEKKVSFSIEPKIISRCRESSVSMASSVYGAEGELPPPIEDDEEMMKKIGKYRFAAAEYIQAIEGTPMILVDGKLYL